MFVSLRKAGTGKNVKEKQIFSGFWSTDRKPHFTASYKSIYRPPEQLFTSCCLNFIIIIINTTLAALLEN